MKKQTIFNGILAITLCLFITACNNTEKANTDTAVTADSTPVNNLMDATTLTDTLKNSVKIEADEKEEADEKNEKNDKDDKDDKK